MQERVSEAFSVKLNKLHSRSAEVLLFSPDGNFMFAKSLHLVSLKCQCLAILAAIFIIINTLTTNCTYWFPRPRLSKIL